MSRSMTELPELERLTDEAIHSAIFDFDPDISETYDECGQALRDLERRIESDLEESFAKSSLLIRLKSHLALMASEMNNHSEAERLAAEVLMRAPPPIRTSP